MNSMMNIGLSGLNTANSGLVTTSKNIANVNTIGYSRQRVIQHTDAITGGAYVTDVQRIFNQFAHAELGNASTLNGHATKMAVNLSRMDELFSGQGQILADSLDKFFGSVATLADTPDDIGLRKLMLERATSLASHFQHIDSVLGEQERNFNQDLTNTVARINDIGSQLATVNEQILTAGKDSIPNEYLDERDRLLTDLSQLTNVETVQRVDGTTDVIIGNGISLVSAGESNTLELQQGSPDSTRQQLVLKTKTHNIRLDGEKMGGELGGLYEFRDQQLRPAREELGRTAIAIADQFNRLQAQGVDLDGLQGGNIFRDINAAPLHTQRGHSYPNNTGNADLSVVIDDVSKLPAGEFDVVWDGADYMIRNADGSIAGPATDFGVTITTNNGAPVIGDRFLIQPTLNGARDIAVEMDDPRGIAAGKPVAPAASEDKLNGISIEPATDPSVFPKGEISLDFDGASYTFVDSTGATVTVPHTDNPDGTVTFGGVMAGVTIDPKNAPAAGDSFAIDFTSGKGDNRNLMDMIELENTTVLNGGETSLSQSLDDLRLNVGGATVSANDKLKATTLMVSEASARMASVSGVSLDEEASNLLNYQQAYQAASKVINSASVVFDTLLASVR